MDWYLEFFKCTQNEFISIYDPVFFLINVCACTLEPYVLLHCISLHITLKLAWNKVYTLVNAVF